MIPFIVVYSSQASKNICAKLQGWNIHAKNPLIFYNNNLNKNRSIFQAYSNLNIENLVIYLANYFVVHFFQKQNTFFNKHQFI